MHRLSFLVSRPELIVESLIMNCQFAMASRILRAIPSLRNDYVLLTYARWVADDTGLSGRTACGQPFIA